MSIFYREREREFHEATKSLNELVASFVFAGTKSTLQSETPKYKLNIEKLSRHQREMHQRCWNLSTAVRQLRLGAFGPGLCVEPCLGRKTCHCSH